MQQIDNVLVDSNTNVLTNQKLQNNEEDNQKVVLKSP